MARSTEGAVSAWWPRLMKYTGKSREAIHPEYLVDAPWHHWYVDYLETRDVVLDVGCANGVHTLAAAGGARSVFGMDADVAQLRIAAAAIRGRALDRPSTPSCSSTSSSISSRVSRCCARSMLRHPEESAS